MVTEIVNFNQKKPFLVKIHNWSNLDFEQKLELGQQMENHFSMIQGRQPRLVKTKILGEVQFYALYDNKEDTIYVNTNFLKMEENPYYYIEAIVHEGRHAYQRDVVDKKIHHNNSEEVQKWTENTAVYISPQNSLMYPLQSSEADAINYSVAKTAEIGQDIEMIYGENEVFPFWRRHKKIGQTTAEQITSDIFGENSQSVIDNLIHDEYINSGMEHQMSVSDLSKIIKNKMLELNQRDNVLNKEIQKYTTQTYEDIKKKVASEFVNGKDKLLIEKNKELNNQKVKNEEAIENLKWKKPKFYEFNKKKEYQLASRTLAKERNRIIAEKKLLKQDWVILGKKLKTPEAMNFIKKRSDEIWNDFQDLIKNNKELRNNVFRERGNIMRLHGILARANQDRLVTIKGIPTIENLRAQTENLKILLIIDIKSHNKNNAKEWC